MGPTLPRELLSRHGLRPKKTWGQNFLINRQLCAEIADLATTPRGGTVIEIGAGLGALTLPLLERAERVIGIERDRDLVRVLRQELEQALDSGQLLLVEANAKTADYVGLFGSGPRPYVVAGNLPYQLTGVLLERLTGLAAELDRAVVLVQAEVAARITAQPNTPAYGALSVFVQAQFCPRPALSVKPGAFFPQPSVDSVLVVLEPRRPPLAAETPTFQKVVALAFRQRRKQLKNAWSSLLVPEQLELAARRAGIALGARGETLGVEAFARMAEAVAEWVV
jgi:16S rRNA (adenine1518-N6/adenine1519-N6)-dimethyltransferase